MATNTMPDYLDDNERVDCGHYEYLDQAVAIPSGALICAECYVKLLAHVPVQPSARLEPQYHTS